MKIASPQKSPLVAWLKNASWVFAGTFLALMLAGLVVELRIAIAVERWQAEVKRQLDADLARMQRDLGKF